MCFWYEQSGANTEPQIRPKKTKACHHVCTPVQASERAFLSGCSGQSYRGHYLTLVAIVTCREWPFPCRPLILLTSLLSPPVTAFTVRTELEFYPTNETSPKPLEGSRQNGVGPCHRHSMKDSHWPRGLMGFQSQALTPSTLTLVHLGTGVTSVVSRTRARQSHSYFKWVSIEMTLRVMHYSSRATTVRWERRVLQEVPPALHLSGATFLHPVVEINLVCPNALSCPLSVPVWVPTGHSPRVKPGRYNRLPYLYRR